MSTPTSTWRFQRDDQSPSGFLSKNRPSTDALSALYQWQAIDKHRNFVVLVDDGLALEAKLTVDLSDDAASDQLDAFCRQVGVKRSRPESN